MSIFRSFFDQSPANESFCGDENVENENFDSGFVWRGDIPEKR